MTGTQGSGAVALESLQILLQKANTQAHTYARAHEAYTHTNPHTVEAVLF